MQHDIDAAAFGPAGEHMAHAVSTCVHCGFCLPACPTYRELGEEMDSPRGRIYLMKAGVEGRAELTPSLVGHIDNCLGCLACVTACPSGMLGAINADRASRHSRWAAVHADPSWPQRRLSPG